jgi:RNA polymerase sigma-70 factor (ECF subfamily)
VVTRISIDVLRSARFRREEYVGPWFPEPLNTSHLLGVAITARTQ